jgi:hypothetical protein
LLFRCKFVIQHRADAFGQLAAAVRLAQGGGVHHSGLAIVVGGEARGEQHR